MGKLIIFIVIIATIWFFFFRKKSIAKKDETPKDKIAHDMIECQECGTYASKDDAIFANGKWYCSKKCLLEKEKE